MKIAEDAFMKYDSIIAGAGFSGATIARKLAEAGKKVLVCDRRKHVSGNMYDAYDENGILVQKYGPQIGRASCRERV